MTGRFSLCESAKANKGATKNLIIALSFDGLRSNAFLSWQRLLLHNDRSALQSGVVEARRHSLWQSNTTV